MAAIFPEDVAPEYNAAQIMPVLIALRSDSIPEFLRFGTELRFVHSHKIGIYGHLLISRRDRLSCRQTCSARMRTA